MQTYTKQEAVARFGAEIIEQLRQSPREKITLPVLAFVQPDEEYRSVSVKVKGGILRACFFKPKGASENEAKEYYEFNEEKS